MRRNAIFEHLALTLERSCLFADGILVNVAKGRLSVFADSVSQRGRQRRRDQAKNPGALIFPLTFTLQTALGALTSSEVGTEQNKWAGGNYGGYVNPDYDAQYADFLNTLDPAKRTETIFQMLKVVDEQLPILPLNFAPLAVIVRKGVEGPGPMSVIQSGSAWNIHTWDTTTS